MATDALLLDREQAHSPETRSVFVSAQEKGGCLCIGGSDLPTTLFVAAQPVWFLTALLA